MSFWIITDNSCDLPQDYIQQQDRFVVLPLTYTLDGQNHIPTGEERQLREFYNALRNGKVATTSQVSVGEFTKAFQPLLETGEQALCIAFSSGLSGTYQSATVAQSMLAESCPQGKLLVVDSLCASLGQGLLVHHALRLRAEGKTIEEVAEWVMNNRQNLIHWFTVDDLGFLRRGGRVSASAAFVGTMLKIKPIMHVNFEGKLIPREKVQGRKRSIRALFEKVRENAIDLAGQTVFISHGDCLEDAQALADMLRGEGVQDILINYVGMVIGAHSGPGTLAVFFLGNGR